MRGYEDTGISKCNASTTFIKNKMFSKNTPHATVLMFWLVYIQTQMIITLKKGISYICNMLKTRYVGK